MNEETEMRFYSFKIEGKVYAGSETHARHSLFWALENSEWADEIINKEITLDGLETK
jgi:hypothetical protein